MPDTNIKDNYLLLPGTILDGRYRIERVIGEGGFGITYEAVNEKIDMTVAIKEFYCREYIRRDVAESNQIQITYAATAEVFDKAKKRFLQEAKTLSGFSDESAIVRIQDYFEENGTAYIVMNYLHGTPLDKYLKENGPMDWKTTTEKIKPLIATLERVHNRGVIHRDISADNIMVLEDGTLCLLDFGTAKDTFKNEKKSTTMVFMKQGYTPIEQYAPHGDVGAWSDVYALSAVCYECVTGECPPDSLQRAIFDEYKPPAELGVDVPAALEAMLRKGLSVKAENRYANMGQMLRAIENISGQKKKKPRKRKLLCVVAAVLVFICGAGIWYYQSHKEQIFFHYEQTESFCLVRDEDASIDKFNSDFEKIKKRIQILVGDNPYICEKDDEKIRCVVLLKCFGKEDPREIIRDLVARPAKWTMSGAEIKPEHIENIGFQDEEKKIMEIRLKEGATEQLNVNPTDFDNSKTTTISMDIGYSHYLSLKGDVISKTLYTWDLQKKWESAAMRELLVHNMSEEPLQVRYDIYSEIQANWEKESAGASFGEKQCEVEELGDNTVTLEYWEGYGYGSELTEGEIINFILTIKERLDMIGIPYAVGREKNHRLRVTLRVNQKDYNEDLFYLLIKDKGSLEVLGRKGTRLVSSYDLRGVAAGQSESGSGVASLSVELEEDDKKELRKKLTEVAKNGAADYYLMVNNIRLLEGRILAGDIASFPEKDEITFDSVKMGNGEISGENKKIVELINDIIKDKNSVFGGYNEILAVQYSGDGEVVATQPEEVRESLRFDDEQEKQIIQKLQEISDDCKIVSKTDYVAGEKLLNITLPKELYAESLTDNKIVLDRLDRIMKMCDIENGTPWKEISLFIKSRYEEGHNAALIYFSHIRDDVVVEKPYSITIIGYEENEGKWLGEVYKKMQKDSRFKGYKIEFSDHSSYRVY